jgi:CheY-like chemotaxis protein
VQILSNLLHNAVKFTPAPGRIRLSAEIRPSQDAGKPHVVLTIADTGVGIAGDMLPRIFDLFTQAEPATEHAQTGLGVGLALVRRLIELQGGEIAAYSGGPGMGSEFVVTIPLSAALAQATAPLLDVPSTRSRVVIIDDNRDAAHAMSMLVEELGGAVRTAHDATAGLKVVEEFCPDIVFLDIGMPGMDGYDACRRLRQTPAERPIVIVAVTGWGQPEDKKRALEAGFDAHLTKPVDLAALADVLAGAVTP